MTRWSDAKTWDVNWKVLECLESGKQAAAKKVMRRDTDEVAFLKILSRQSDAERRTRFFREASAYETFQRPNVPKFIESNAHRHAQSDTKVYLVMEYIAGETLASVIDHERRSLEDAVALTVRLLDIAAHFHHAGWVHRDIKPDNILIRGGGFVDPVLVDFGVSYRDTITPDFATEVGQELGNRFLRLPELAADSPSKQDSRTDLSFIAGILFFCLTGESPRQLLNFEGKMPHQRECELAVLRAAAGPAILPLLCFFDQAFRQRISARFATAAEMTTKLTALLEAFHNGANVSDSTDLESLRARAQSSASAEFARLKAVYHAAEAVIHSVHALVLSNLRPTYATHHQHWLDFSNGEKFELGFHHFADPGHRFAPKFLIAVVGDEIVVHMGDEVVYRTDAVNPNFENDRFRKELERRFIAGVDALIDSEPKPPS
ncbi:MAG: serine/threonine protein kinase [Rhodanobacteraceae bacterium]